MLSKFCLHILNLHSSTPRPLLIFSKNVFVNPTDEAQNIRGLDERGSGIKNNLGFYQSPICPAAISSFVTKV